MKKLFLLFVVMSFILWILPLGVFIKPSQQKIFCDGQRAMCMCHAMVSKSADKAMEHGIVLKSTASTGKENSSGGNYFVSTKPVIILNLHFSLFFENQHLSYKSPYLATLEYVPKI